MTGFVLAWIFVIVFGMITAAAIVGGPEGGLVAVIYLISILVMWDRNVFDQRSDAEVYTDSKAKCEELKGELLKKENSHIRYECRVSPTITVPVD